MVSVSVPAPLPGPGTYARHNGVDMPALLPDGSQSRLSVSHVLAPADESPEPGSRPLPPGPADRADPADPADGAGAPTTAGVAGSGAGASSVHGGQEAGDQW